MKGNIAYNLNHNFIFIYEVRQQRQIAGSNCESFEKNMLLLLKQYIGNSKKIEKPNKVLLSYSKKLKL